MNDADRVIWFLEEHEDELNAAGDYFDIHIRVRPEHIDIDLVTKTRHCGCPDEDETA